MDWCDNLEALAQVVRMLADFYPGVALEQEPEASLRQRLQVIIPIHYSKREFFIDSLLVRIHHIICMILVDRPCAMGV